MQSRPDQPNRNHDPIDDQDLTRQQDPIREHDLTRQGGAIGEPDMTGPRETPHTERTVTDEENANTRNSTVVRQQPDPAGERRNDRVREERAHTAPTVATGMFFPVIILGVVALILIIWFVL